ncbi:MAG: HAMP domain-containing sensor histidine kinase [Acidobacteriota bacterium]
MIRRSTSHALVLYLIYLAAIAVTTALLVFWVVVVQRFNSEINQMVSKLGFEWNQFHWFVTTSGAGLFFLVLVALTFLLAVTLSERRYSRKQDDFLTNVSHELKSPVAAIKLHAQTLQQGDLRAQDQERFISYIVRETERIGTLVDNLLESSRILAGGDSREFQPVDLEAFFADYQQAALARFDLRQIELSFEVDTRSTVMASAEALQRILDNLIDNALRFTGDGGKILCQVRDGSTEAEIIVADNGIGIPKRELPKIFDRFYRLSREIGNRRRGTGLGLSIVRGLVEDMRGTIRALSTDEEPGTRFEIHLPRVRAGSAGEPPAKGSEVADGARA